MVGALCSQHNLIDSGESEWNRGCPKLSPEKKHLIKLPNKIHPKKYCTQNQQIVQKRGVLVIY